MLSVVYPIIALDLNYALSGEICRCLLVTLCAQKKIMLLLQTWQRWQDHIISKSHCASGTELPMHQCVLHCFHLPAWCQEALDQLASKVDKCRSMTGVCVAVVSWESLWQI